MTLDSRERQLRDESLVMRYSTREYQIDQPSEMPLVSLPARCVPTIFNHETENDLIQTLDRVNTYQCSAGCQAVWFGLACQKSTKIAKLI